MRKGSFGEKGIFGGFEEKIHVGSEDRARTEIWLGHPGWPGVPRVARGGSKGPYKTTGAVRGAAAAAVGLILCHTLISRYLKTDHGQRGFKWQYLKILKAGFILQYTR